MVWSIRRAAPAESSNCKSKRLQVTQCSKVLHTQNSTLTMRP